MRTGDTVKLTKKAIKNFYGTDELLNAYEFENGEFDFITFVNTQTGFENGEKLGVVLELINYTYCTIAKVWFNGAINQNYHFYNIDDLRVIK